MTRHLSSTLALAASAVLILSIGAVGQESVADEIPESGEPLPAGRYVSDDLGPIIEFRVRDGWQAGPSVAGPIITLENTIVPGGVLTITRFDGEAFVDSCDPLSSISVDVSVQRATEIIGANPLLRVAPPALTDVDGRQAVQLDVGVPAVEDCQVPFLLLWLIPEMEQGEFVQVPDQQSRFILVEVEDEVIVIAIESFPGVPFGSVLDASMDIVDSIRITPASAIAETPAPSAVDVSPAPSNTPGPSPAPQRTLTPLATDSPEA